MTRDRIYGADHPVLDWLRKQEQLPSSSSDCGIAITDVDICVHRYKIEMDGLGTREVQAILDLEVKTRNAKPTFAQHDTYFKKHQFRGAKKICSEAVWHFGVYFLSISGTSIDNSAVMKWGTFKGNSREIKWRNVDEQTLLRILRFELHPATLKPNVFRRHHTSKIVQVINVKEPLGFVTEYRQVLQS